MDHHNYFYLHIDGKKHPIYTYISHSIKEYGNSLMGEVKKQLKFESSSDLENFFDCPMSKEGYIKMLKKNKSIDIDGYDED